MINIDVFHFETPLCKAFKEFNYLSQVNVDVLTKDIPGFKTYKGYKDDWIYEWNVETSVNEKPWTDDEEDGYCNIKDLPGLIREGNLIRYQDYEWYTTIKDNELNEEALNNKAILEELMNEEEESIVDRNETRDNKKRFDEHELMEDDDDDIGDLEDYFIQKDHPYYVNEKEERSKERRCKLLGIPYVKPPTCKSKKFEVVKYSFGPEEEYVTIKEYEYDIGSKQKKTFLKSTMIFSERRTKDGP
ncbi:hypothetical protein Tco_1392551 [Tanacetum coccineum]